jgi:poly(3-hydroxybutyrate) depolymerase
MANLRGDNDGHADLSEQGVEASPPAPRRVRLSPAAAFAVVSLLLLMGSILAFQAAKPTDTEHRGLDDSVSFTPALPRTSQPVTTNVAPVAPCAVAGDASTAAPGDFRFVTRIDGDTRHYSVHIPSTYDPATPHAVIMSLHDRGATSDDQRVLTRLATHSDRFIIITPVALGSDAAWTSGVATSVDNVGFLDLALAQVSARLCVDPTQIHLLGIGDGAHMASRFVCESKATVASVVLHVRSARQLSCGARAAAELTVISPAHLPGLERVATTTADNRGCDDAMSTTVSTSLRLVEWVGCTDELRLFIVDDDTSIWPGDNATRQNADPPASRETPGGQRVPDSSANPANPETGDRIDATLLALAAFSS